MLKMDQYDAIIKKYFFQSGLKLLLGTVLQDSRKFSVQKLILTDGSGVDAFENSDTFWGRSRVKLQSSVSYLLFLNDEGSVLTYQ